jgi:hypothetical protein
MRKYATLGTPLKLQDRQEFLNNYNIKAEICVFRIRHAFKL